MSNSIRSNPGALQAPGFNGRFVVDTWRGKLRIRKWPRKRGPPKSAKVRRQNDWFRDANRILRLAEGSQMAAAIAMTRGTGLYPRDLLIKAMSGPLYTLYRADGRVMTQRKAFIEDVMFQGAVLNLTSDQGLATNNNNFINWPLPQIDTAGMWDPGSPARLTIPPGVTIIQFNAGARCTGSFPGELGMFITDSADTVIGGIRAEQGVTKFLTASSGPLPVSPGDWFRLNIVPRVAATLTAVPATYFSATILQAS